MFRNQVLLFWDFIFKDFFLAPVWFYTKTSPDKSCFIVETSLYTLVEKMFTNMQIRSLILKIHLALSLGGKNSKSQESKTQDFFPVTFFPKTLENLNFLPKFLFPGFFSSKFFFYDSYKCPLRTIVRILEYAVNAVNINILIILI